MILTMLKSKIHRATVTGSDLNYEGSIAIDYKLMKSAKLNEFEKALAYFEKIDMRKAPHVALRIAECSTKLGNKNKAIATLETITHAPVDATLKEKAQLTLAQLKQAHA